MRAFTLLETTVWILLIGCFLSLSVPSLRELHASLAVHRAAEAVTTDLARAILASGGVQGGFELEADESGYIITSEEGEEFVKRAFDPPLSISVSSAQERKIFISTAHSLSPATIELRLYNCRCQISLSLRGRIRKSCFREE